MSPNDLQSLGWLTQSKSPVTVQGSPAPQADLASAVPLMCLHRIAQCFFPTVARVSAGTQRHAFDLMVKDLFQSTRKKTWSLYIKHVISRASCLVKKKKKKSQFEFSLKKIKSMLAQLGGLYENRGSSSSPSQHLVLWVPMHAYTRVHTCTHARTCTHLFSSWNRYKTYWMFWVLGTSGYLSVNYLVFLSRANKIVKHL